MMLRAAVIVDDSVGRSNQVSADEESFDENLFRHELMLVGKLCRDLGEVIQLYVVVFVLVDDRGRALRAVV